MFASPCILRSTQCAALIALATVAGIARMDTKDATVYTHAGYKDIKLFSASIQTHGQGLEQSQLSPDPWLRRVFAFAYWWLGEDTFAPSHFGPNQAEPDDAPCPVATLAPADSRVPSPESVITLPRLSYTCFSLCCVPYLVPFAVGPPCGQTLYPLNADGTHVPGDSAAIRLSGFKVAASDEDSSSARLARLPCSGPARAGSLSNPRRVARGRPGSRRTAGERRLLCPLAPAFRP